MRDIELIVASFRCYFLIDRRKELIRRLCGLVYSFNDDILDRIVAIFLEHELVEHQVGPSLCFAFFENRDSSDYETSTHDLLFFAIKNYKTSK